MKQTARFSISAEPGGLFHPGSAGRCFQEASVLFLNLVVTFRAFPAEITQIN